jgi:Flp pilus assembly protein TadG
MKLLRQAKLRTQGSVAVEFALVLPIMVVMLAAPLFFGWIFWHYTVAQKASQDAVRFLASASAAEIRTSGPGGEAPVAAVARAMVMAEIAELRTGMDPPVVDVLCDGRTCAGLKIPSRVTVSVQMSIVDTFLSVVTLKYTGGDPIVLNPVATTDYVGS